MIRRLIFAIIAIFLSELLVIQLLMHTLSSIGILMFLFYLKPLESKFLNAIEIMNEITLLISSYFLYFFTSFIQSVEMKYEMGWYFIGIAAFNIFINWCAMVYRFLIPLVNFIRIKVQNCRKTKKE